MNFPQNNRPITLSIGILAWNEEGGIGRMLESLFAQSLWVELDARGERGEIVCLANGCTDRTTQVARSIFGQMEREHPARHGLQLRVVDLPVPGRNQAWNRFVHEFSAREAKYLCLMDADILFNRPDTLALVVGALEKDPHLGGASDLPVKAIALKARPNWRERLSLATSDMTDTIPGRLNGMLYCLRAGIARNLYLPRDVLANDDGFFKAAICTDFFRTPLDPSKVATIRAATHLYEPYLELRDVLNNQKRQMIGQATVHVIVEHLRTLPEADRAALATTLRWLEARDPDWLKKRIAVHVGRTFFFWRLFPGLLGFRWQRLMRLPGRQRLAHLPAALAGFAVTLVAAWQAARFLRRGVTSYWPKRVRAETAGAPALAPEPKPRSSRLPVAAGLAEAGPGVSDPGYIWSAATANREIRPSPRPPIPHE